MYKTENCFIDFHYRNPFILFSLYNEDFSENTTKFSKQVRYGVAQH